MWMQYPFVCGTEVLKLLFAFVIFFNFKVAYADEAAPVFSVEINSSCLKR